MIIDTSNSRIALNLSQEEALQMIKDLSEMIIHSNKTGNAWKGQGVVMDNENGQQSPGRFIMRVEK